MNRQIEFIYEYLLQHDARVLWQESTSDYGIRITFDVEGTIIYMHIYPDSSRNYSSYSLHNKGGIYD